MASIVLNVTDESLLSQIKKACSLLKGVSDVKVIKSEPKTKEISQTKGYAEAMEDIRTRRVHEAENTDDMFMQILGYVPR